MAFLTFCSSFFLRHVCFGCMMVKLRTGKNEQHASGTLQNSEHAFWNKFTITVAVLPTSQLEVFWSHPSTATPSIASEFLGFATNDRFSPIQVHIGLVLVSPLKCGNWDNNGKPRVCRVGFEDSGLQGRFWRLGLVAGNLQKRPRISHQARV